MIRLTPEAKEKGFAKKRSYYAVILRQVNTELGYLPAASEYAKLSSSHGWPSYATMSRYLGPGKNWSNVLRGGTETDGPDVRDIVSKEPVVDRKEVGSKEPAASEKDVRSNELAMSERDADGASAEKLDSDDSNPDWPFSPGMKLEEELWEKLMALEKRT